MPRLLPVAAVAGAALFALATAPSAFAVVVTSGATLIDPYVAPNGDCGGGEGVSIPAGPGNICNPTPGTGSVDANIGSYAGNPDAGNNDFGGASVNAEWWYLRQLLNDNVEPFQVPQEPTRKFDVGGSVQETGTQPSEKPTPEQAYSIVGQNWIISSEALQGYSFLVLKGPGNLFGFYQLTGGDVTGTGTGLSHWTAFTPLPAAAVFALTGLAGFFGLGWYRRRVDGEVAGTA